MAAAMAGPVPRDMHLMPSSGPLLAGPDDGPRPLCRAAPPQQFLRERETPMSDRPTPTTAEIFDLATGLDTLAVGSAPAESFAMLDGVMTQATGMAMYNAVTAQQRDSTARMAAVTMTCAKL